LVGYVVWTTNGESSLGREKSSSARSRAGGDEGEARPREEEQEAEADAPEVRPLADSGVGDDDCRARRDEGGTVGDDAAGGCEQDAHE